MVVVLTKQERQSFIERVKKEGPFIILEAEEKYRDDEVLMKGLIKLKSSLITCASERLKKKESIIETACLNPSDHLSSWNGVPHGFAIEFIDIEYLDNHPEVVISFLSNRMEYASVLPISRLMKNKKIARCVLENLDRCPMLWFDLPDEVKYKKSVVMKVINTMPNMVGKLPVELQCDVDIIRQAASNHHPEFNAVVAMYDTLSPVAKRNPEVCKELVKADPRVFPYLKYYDEDIAKIGVSYDGEYLQYVPKKYVSKELILLGIASSEKRTVLQFVDKELTDDEEIVRAAVTKCGWEIHNVSPRLSKNQEIIDIAINASPELKKYGFKKSNNSHK